MKKIFLSTLLGVGILAAIFSSFSGREVAETREPAPAQLITAKIELINQ